MSGSAARLRACADCLSSTLLRGTGTALLIEDIQLADGAPIVGVCVPDIRRSFASEVTVLAVRRAGQLLAPPPEDLRLSAGDVIVVAGTDRQLRDLELACTGRSSPTLAGRSSDVT